MEKDTKDTFRRKHDQSKKLILKTVSDWLDKSQGLHSRRLVLERKPSEYRWQQDHVSVKVETVVFDGPTGGLDS